MNSKIYNIMKELRNQYPNANTALEYKNKLQLLISTILSAQSTDKSVNKVTEDFYKDYPDLESLLTLTQKEIEKKIKKIGIYKNKAKNIYNTLRIIKEKHNGKVPDNMKDLMKLPGVGRKTASVVLAVGFGTPAFPVDTHVYRICRRIGLSQGKTPDEVSDDIMKITEKKNWIEFHHLLINHGRNICKARNPKCDGCNIEKYCEKIGV